MSTTTNQPPTEGGPSPVKHRACDECRSRKLACTKETDGCSRCKREGIVCHYSAQKQMGRPRKKPNGDGASANQATSVSISAPAPPDSSATTSDTSAIRGPDVPMDLDPSSFVDPSLHITGTSDAGLLDLLGPDFVSTQPFHAQEWQPKPNPVERDIWSFDIDFDNHHPPSGSAGNSDTSAALSFGTPSLSSHGASTPENTNASTTPSQASCGCLAGLYLALDSLNNLPTEVEPAIRAARRATRAAHENAHCKVCCPPLTESMTISMSSFQNMMVLGALFPSVVDAYRRIVDMIEIETARAICERRQLRFSLRAYGGMWGRLGSDEAMCGNAHHHYDDVMLEPAMWRLTIRALLKVDVYGINCRPEGPGSDTLRFTQVGLKDIVVQLEERSSARHAEVDALLEAGLAGPTGPLGKHAQHSRLEEPQCKRIIQLAKDAIASLDIP
ncbi:hypothetical protein KVR01_004958 [Diaporthe batatas]|uniref:uncharacterized protein n=1 Tax=Diaporthe batatas TaxID=748121 RepID=UPI001D041C6E|nr:uncharacterized protein KVR01_004958 [Diaporthe batatas]KAG8164683.1 hypothetical protein KVR01_004958 [Diaporthe batatas]